jgi:tetrahydromethanopterin S-methyltransferase subunit H
MMTQSRIRMGHPYGQTPDNVYSDFDWIRRHERELLEKYGECSIIVYKQQVIGVGATYAVALENAEQNLPPTADEITPGHQWLQHRHPILRAHPKPTGNNL